MRFAGILTFVAVFSAGCSNVPWVGSDAAGPDVRTLMLSEVQSCKLLDQVTAKSQPGDADAYAGAESRAKSLAMERAGNAISVRSYQVQAGGERSGMVSMTANVYACGLPQDK